MTLIFSNHRFQYEVERLFRTTKLVDENEPVQLSLFDLDFSDTSANKTNANADFPKKPSPEKQKKLDAALDSIRKKSGKKAVTRASEME